MKRIIILLGILCVSFAQTPQVLLLDDYLELALNNHPLVEKSQAEYMAQLNANDMAKGINDWNLFMSSSYTKGYSMQGTTMYSGDTEILVAQAGLSSLLADTGTRLNLTSEATRMKAIPGFNGGTSTIYNANLNISIVQPLLKNAFGQMDRYPLQLAKFGNELASIKYSEDLENFYKTLIDDYLSWQLAYITMVITKEQYNKAKDQVSFVEKQYKRGASEKLELVQANQSLKSKSVQFLSAKQGLENKGLVIASRIGDAKNKDATSLLPQNNIQLGVDGRVADSVNYLQTRSKLAKLLKIQEKMQKETLLYQENKSKPSAELFLSKTVGSAENTKEDMANNLGSQSPFSIGLQIETPLQNTAANKEEQAARERLTKIQKENENIMKDSVDGLLTIYQNIKSLDEMIRENEELVNLSIEFAALEEKKFKQGRSSLYFLINAQDKLLGTKMHLASLKSSKMLLINKLSSLLDTYQKTPLLMSIINKGAK